MIDLMYYINIVTVAKLQWNLSKQTLQIKDTIDKKPP